MAELPSIVYNLTNNRFEYVDMVAAAAGLMESAEIIQPIDMGETLALVKEINESYETADVKEEEHIPGGIRGKLQKLYLRLTRPLRSRNLLNWARQVDYNARLTRSLNSLLGPLARMEQALQQQGRINSHVAHLLIKFDTKKILDLVTYLDRKDEGLKLGIRRLESWQKEIGEEVRTGLATMQEEVSAATTEFRTSDAEWRQEAKERREMDEALARRLDLLERNLRYFRGRMDDLLYSMEKAPKQSGQKAIAKEAAKTARDDAYYTFEDSFRGPEPLIRDRLQQHVALFSGCKEIVDIGCGRGEFLKCLQEVGLNGMGIDLNRRMVEVCKEQGLQAEQADLFGWMESRPNASVDGIFCSQVVEHFNGDAIMRFVHHARRILRPLGLLVIETQNAASVYSLSQNYTMDVDHVTPVNPEAMRHILWDKGFDVEIKLLNPVPAFQKLTTVQDNGNPELCEQLNRNFEVLNKLLFADQDFAAIARKTS